MRHLDVDGSCLLPDEETEPRIIHHRGRKWRWTYNLKPTTALNPCLASQRISRLFERVKHVCSPAIRNLRTRESTDGAAGAMARKQKMMWFVEVRGSRVQVEVVLRSEDQHFDPPDLLVSKCPSARCRPPLCLCCYEGLATYSAAPAEEQVLQKCVCNVVSGKILVKRLKGVI